MRVHAHKQRRSVCQIGYGRRFVFQVQRGVWSDANRVGRSVTVFVQWWVFEVEYAIRQIPELGETE